MLTILIIHTFYDVDFRLVFTLTSKICEILCRVTGSKFSIQKYLTWLKFHNRGMRRKIFDPFIFTEYGHLYTFIKLWSFSQRKSVISLYYFPEFEWSTNIQAWPLARSRSERVSASLIFNRLTNRFGQHIANILFWIWWACGIFNVMLKLWVE